MSRARMVKTNFTGGEVTPFLRGRADLSAYENGAARMKNVFVHPTGQPPLSGPGVMLVHRRSLL